MFTTYANVPQYFDNLLDAAIYSLRGIYDEEYIKRNYTSPSSKVRKVIKALQTNGYVLKDPIVKKYIAKHYDGLQTQFNHGTISQQSPYFSNQIVCTSMTSQVYDGETDVIATSSTADNMVEGV